MKQYQNGGIKFSSIGNRSANFNSFSCVVSEAKTIVSPEILHNSSLLFFTRPFLTESIFVDYAICDIYYRDVDGNLDEVIVVMNKNNLYIID